ncbi:MAG: CBS domain-containing protein [Candidatus Latescibacteria bacterium]|jgi:CBS domain-containing protein|nr:CBS domain-containing protein [Candidatus Latescibacterota bacterium]
MKIKDILSIKGFTVVGIDPKRTLKDALATMVEKRVGALVVRGESGTLEGIITERDIMRAVHAEMPLGEKPVEEVMTRDVVTGAPEDHIEYAMNEMTEKRFRHMPIVEADNLLGVLSIGDIVRAERDRAKDNVDELWKYISGPAAAGPPTT